MPNRPQPPTFGSLPVYYYLFIPIQVCKSAYFYTHTHTDTHPNTTQFVTTHFVHTTLKFLGLHPVWMLRS